MAKLSKRAKALAAKVESNRLYPAADALSLVKECANAKFDESVDVAVQLGIDPRKSDQLVRGSVVLPRGTGKPVRVACSPRVPRLTKPRLPVPTSSAWKTWPNRSRPQPELRRGHRLAGRHACGWLAGPDPRSPWPDAEPEGRYRHPQRGRGVKNAKSGQVQYRTDKAGIIHSTIGRASFDVAALQENLAALVDALVRAKPPPRRGCTCARWPCPARWALA